eukprot:scaffold18815_cov116-Isochrysis_galbana.AAC.5
MKRSCPLAAPGDGESLVGAAGVVGAVACRYEATWMCAQLMVLRGDAGLVAPRLFADATESGRRQLEHRPGQ